MNKIKVALIDSPKEILDYLGDNIQLVDNLREARIAIVASDTEISPEYYGEKTKNEKFHDPAKDYELVKTLRNLASINRSLIIIGLGKGASYIDIIGGGRVTQSKRTEKDAIMELVPAPRHEGNIFQRGTHFTVPSYEHYYQTMGSDTYPYLVTYANRYELPIVYRYNMTSSTNTMLAMHVDPFSMDPNSKEWAIFRAVIMLNTHSNIDPMDACMRCLGDVSIWGSESKAGSRLNYTLDSHACFGSMVKGPLALLGHNNNNVEVDWTIKVMKREAWDTGNGRCITFMKKEDYEDYYKRLQEVYPFDFEIDDTSNDYVLIKLHIDAPCMWHKMILTQIRYIYQYSMCYILDDALTLKKMDAYKNMDILDIMNIVAKTIYPQVYESNEYMIYGYSEGNADVIIRPFNDEEFRSIAKAEGDKYEHPYINNIGKHYTMGAPKGLKALTDEFPCFVSWNVFKKTFDIRLPYYENNLKIFKKLIKND